MRIPFRRRWLLLEDDFVVARYASFDRAMHEAYWFLTSAQRAIDSGEYETHTVIEVYDSHTGDCFPARRDFTARIVQGEIVYERPC